jgi:hypothetical protein
VDAALLAALSAADIAWTRHWLAQPAWHDTYETDPLLGRHPSLFRQVATGLAFDAIVLRCHNGTLRRVLIGVEAGNVARNFTLHVKFQTP